MRYCFWCGGKLPESTRGKLFTTPDPNEMDEVRTLLRDARSPEDVIVILGPPDEFDEQGNGQIGNRTTSVFSRWNQRYRYTKRWKTLEVWVPIVIEGSFHFSIHGHNLDHESAAE